MLRTLFLIVPTVITFVVVVTTINLIVAILYLILKPLSTALHRKIIYHLYSYGLSFFVFFFDWYSSGEIYLHTNKNDYEKHFGKEHMYIISNHSSEIDWIFAIAFCDKTQLLGNLKGYIVKNLKYLAPLGLAMFLSDMILMERNFEKDKITIRNKIKTLMDYHDKIAIFLYPEGSRFTKEKLESSNLYAKENNLPILKHHLNPRTKGFVISVPAMRNKIQAVYDLTTIFVPNKPKIFDILKGKKIVAHCYLKRIPIENIPQDEKEISQFMYNLFDEKDKLVDRILKTDNFYSDANQDKVIRLKPKISTLINTISMYIICVGLVFYMLLHLIQNGQIIIAILCIIGYALSLAILYKICITLTMKTVSSYGIRHTNKT